ncbi:AAA family ATPase, partial [Nostocoides australiense]|uniref:AAA family ATPase n=1 Tax=Nostocoides australiense TaxID=99480 RepID=UPI000660DE27
MKLHHLSVEAFGPFVARQEIDFDDVSGAGVFLVHGPTGAGKTSLLDAICFALFSDVPGDRQARGLRSELAEPDCPPRVRLEFTAAGRRMRVERTAEFTRPKRRGTGQVRVQSTVTLSEFAGSQWRPVSTRIDEAAEVLQDLLGMGLNQFRRVALLPQGDFAAFLHTTPEARRALLERLFDVERFTTLESWFAERRRTLTQQVAAAQQALHHQIATLTDVLATAPPAALAPLSDADELAFAAVPVGEWAGLVPRLEVALSAWAGDEFGAFQRAETQEQAAGARRDEAERIAGLRARARVASDALTRLREDATRIEVLRQRAADGL